MRIEYSKRATRELRRIGEYYHDTAGLRVAEELEARIGAVVERIRREPLSAPELEQRPGMHVVLLIRWIEAAAWRPDPNRNLSHPTSLRN